MRSPQPVVISRIIHYRRQFPLGATLSSTAQAWPGYESAPTLASGRFSICLDRPVAQLRLRAAFSASTNRRLIEPFTEALLRKLDSVRAWGSHTAQMASRSMGWQLYCGHHTPNCKDGGIYAFELILEDAGLNAVVIEALRDGDTATNATAILCFPLKGSPAPIAI